MQALCAGLPAGSRRRRHGDCRVLGATTTCGADLMGKYLLAWVMGVPAFVLVVVYLIFN